MLGKGKFSKNFMHVLPKALGSDPGMNTLRIRRSLSSPSKFLGIREKKRSDSLYED